MQQILSVLKDIHWHYTLRYSSTSQLDCDYPILIFTAIGLSCLKTVAVHTVKMSFRTGCRAEIGNTLREALLGTETAVNAVAAMMQRCSDQM